MIKIPTYILCIKKLVSVLGVDYSDTEKSTGKSKLRNEGSDFVIQGDHYTGRYVREIQDLFAGEDEEKRELVRLFLVMSESLVRELTSKNYYTLASQKRAMWGLLIFYYIPHIACIISIYKKEFGIPECLITNDFMLPFVDNGKVIQPTLRLTRYLTSIERIIDGVKFYDASNELNSYIKNLRKKSVPTYKKHQEIVDELRAVPTLANKISEISLTFRAAIVSARVYRELKELFDESYAISLIDYFKQCLKSSEQFCNGVDANNNFSYFFYLYPTYYEYELCYTLTTHKRLGVHFTFQSLEDDDVLYGHNELKEKREELREEIFESFNSFLYVTTNDTQDNLDEANTDDLTKGILRFKFLSEADFLDENHEDMMFLLNKIEYVFSSPEKLLQDEVSEFLQEFKSHCYQRCKNDPLTTE